MMPLASYAVWVMNVLGIACLALLTWSVFLVVVTLSLHLRAREVAPSCCVCAVLTTLGCVLCDVIEEMLELDGLRTLLAAWLAGVPLAWVVALLVVAAFVEAGLMWQLRVHRRASVDTDSVKEALDALPDAALFCTEDGRLLLRNARAVELALEPASKEGLLHDARGRFWQLSRTRLQLGDYAVNELVATDVTDEYALVLELEGRVARLGEVNERLRAYGADLTRLTREEEVLAAKTHVHDELGRALVALRVLELQKPEARDRAGLLALWRAAVHLLEESGAKERATDDWELLVKAAEAIGVRLTLEGELPQAPGARKLAVAVAHECLNNAVRHGGAHSVCVRCAVARDWVEFSVENDGAAPTAPAEPSGGLANLRAAVKHAGGELQVTWAPRVVVRARFFETGPFGR